MRGVGEHREWEWSRMITGLDFQHQLSVQRRTKPESCHPLISAKRCCRCSTVVASAPFFAVVCWVGSIQRRNTSCLDKLVRKVCFVVVTHLDSLTSMVEGWMLSRPYCLRCTAVSSRPRSSFSLANWGDLSCPLPLGSLSSRGEEGANNDISVSFFFFFVRLFEV